MSEFVKALEVVNSCKTSGQNNTAFAYLLLYDKEMNRRNNLYNGYSLIKWNREYLKLKCEMEMLHAALDDNMQKIISH